MQSAGEKQFYMLALLEMMFQHLPSDIRVGCCMMWRACCICRVLSTGSWTGTWTAFYSQYRCSMHSATGGPVRSSIIR
jgi:hypothetical protein